MSDTTATHATITLPGTWVEYWNDREYSNPRADVEYRNLDAKIQAGIRRAGRGKVTRIELTHEETVILDEVVELMVMVADQSEPGPERSRELRACTTAALRILEALNTFAPAVDEPTTAQAYEQLADKADELGTEYARLWSKRANNSRSVTEGSLEAAYEAYRTACQRARVCTVLDCRTPSPYYDQCAGHCVDQGADHDHEGESVAYLVANPPKS